MSPGYHVAVAGLKPNPCDTDLWHASSNVLVAITERQKEYVQIPPEAVENWVAISNGGFVRASIAARAERARVSAKGDKDGSTALHITCFDPLAPVELVRLLASTVYDVDVSSKNNRGNTCLHMACYSGNLEAVRFLVEELGCGVNHPGEHGDTPLHAAVFQDQGQPSRLRDVEVIKLLLNGDADVNAQDEEGCTPLMAAMTEAIKVLELQNRGCSAHIVDLLLASKSTNPNVKDNLGRSAVHIAVKAITDSARDWVPWRRRSSCYADRWVPKLLELGADATLRAEDNLCPFYSLIRCNSVQLKCESDKTLSYSLWCDMWECLDAKEWVQSLKQASPCIEQAVLEAVLMLELESELGQAELESELLLTESESQAERRVDLLLENRVTTIQGRRFLEILFGVQKNYDVMRACHARYIKWHERQTVPELSSGSSHLENSVVYDDSDYEAMPPPAMKSPPAAKSSPAVNSPQVAPDATPGRDETEVKPEIDEIDEARRHYCEAYEEHDAPTLASTSGVRLRHKCKCRVRIDSDGMQDVEGTVLDGDGEVAFEGETTLAERNARLQAGAVDVESFPFRRIRKATNRLDPGVDPGVGTRKRIGAKRTLEPRTADGSPVRSSARRAAAPTIKQEDFLDGDINCPSCKCAIYVSTKGCNTITCRSSDHTGRSWFTFCYHCRSECPGGLPCPQCPERNDEESRLLARELLNEAAERNPIIIDDVEEDE